MDSATPKISAEEQQRLQEKHTTMMVGFDAENARSEIKLIKAYCTQYMGKIVDIKESSLFSSAVCAVPKDKATEFKMKLSGHLESARSK